MGSCRYAQRKVRYPTRARAASVVMRMRDKFSEYRLRVYHCQACGGFHLTSQEKREGRYGD